MTIQFRTLAARRVSMTREAIAPAFWLAWAWIADKTPIIGLAATRRRRRVVLPPYQRVFTLRGALLGLLAIPTVIFACLAYGFFFGLTAPYLLVPFVVPIALIAALIIWALPDQRSAPTLPIEFLLFSYFVVLVLWPRYLAITLPGTPWITLQRIVGLPMGALFLVSLSISKIFRSMVMTSVTTIRPLWICFCGFLFTQLLTTLVSSSPIAAAQIVFDEQLYWTVVFILSSVIFRMPIQIERYLGLLCMLSCVVIFITFIEHREQHVIWVSNIPEFLRVPDPSVQNTLRAGFRPGTNVYRAKATFTSPLALSEYISLLSPVFLYFAFTKRNIIIRILCAMMVPITFIAVRMTDARLGVVGVFSSVLLYGLLWSIVRWRSHPRDILAAATVYAAPVTFVAGMGAIFASTRLRQMALGGGAEAGSTAARQTQLGMAIGKFLVHPWGYGAGQAGKSMGFSVGDFITIDNYFISILLEYGIFGVLFWYGMFVAGVIYAVKYSVSSKYGHRYEAKLLAPLAVSLTSFMIIKWVHGQSDNHSVFFLMLGMISALVYRLKRQTTKEVEASPPLTIAMPRGIPLLRG